MLGIQALGIQAGNHKSLASDLCGLHRYQKINEGNDLISSMKHPNIRISSSTSHHYQSHGDQLGSIIISK